MFMIGSDGMWTPVGEGDASQITVSDEGHEAYWNKSVFANYDRSIRLNLEVDVDALEDVVKDFHEQSPQSIVFVGTEEKWYFRHGHVWQYRRERKGNKANRKTRGYWETTERRSVIPNALVTGIDQEFCAGAELPNATVEFEVTQFGPLEK